MRYALIASLCLLSGCAQTPTDNTWTILVKPEVSHDVVAARTEELWI